MDDVAFTNQIFVFIQYPCFYLKSGKKIQEWFIEICRDGTIDLVSELEAHSVPMLIFSAGLGNMVTAILEHYKVLRPNVHILSNFLQFKDGFVDGFQKDVIHPLNKNGRSASHSPYFQVRLQITIPTSFVRTFLEIRNYWP